MKNNSEPQKAKQGCLSLHRMLVTMAAALCAMSANAATFHWKDDVQSTDWTDGNNYVEGTKPSANDIVEIGNTTVYLSDSDMDSFNLASSLNRIAPSNNNSKIVFTINGTAEPLEFGAGISRTADYHSKEGTIEKRGDGTLKLTKTREGTMISAVPCSMWLKAWWTFLPALPRSISESCA